MADTDSILDVTKQLVGIEPESTDYDLILVTHINSVFFTLDQLGVGPAGGFMIVDNTAVWADFIGEEKIMAVKTYMGLKIRLLFDPPETGPLTQAMERQIEQMEWRLNVQQESERHAQVAPIGATIWSVPNGTLPEESQDGDIIFDPLTGNLWRDV